MKYSFSLLSYVNKLQNHPKLILFIFVSKIHFDFWHKPQGWFLRVYYNVAQSTLYELTRDDFNWNSSTQTTENPNAIALWLLPTGLYHYSDYSGHGVYVSNNKQAYNGVAIVMEAIPGMPARIIWQANGNMSKMYMAAVSQTGAFDQGPYVSTFVSE